jgi:hypothetical protein
MAEKKRRIKKVCKIVGKRTCSKFIYSAIGLFIVLILTMLGKNIISLLVAIGLLILGSLSSQFVRMLGSLNLGVEFIPFVSIMFFYAFGFPTGMLATLIMMIISLLLVGHISIDMLFSVGIFVIIGLLTLILDFGSIAINGIILIIIFNIMSLAIELFLGLDIVKNVMYFFGSIFFNYVLFKFFSEILFSLLVL